MKKLTTFILLLITLQYIFGHYAVYLLNGRAIKQNMHHAIAAGIFQTEQVVSITVPLESFTEDEAGLWQQPEIQYGGKMYDVIQTCRKGDNLVIQCLCDDDENNLIASFLNTIHKSGQLPGKSTSRFNQLFSPFILNDGWYSHNWLIHNRIPYLQKPVAPASKGFQYIPAPPPWQA